MVDHAVLRLASRSLSGTMRARDKCWRRLINAPYGAAKYIAGMTVDCPTTRQWAGPRESGLDTTNGLEFVQRRIALFARIIALISLAFLIVGTVGRLVLPLTSLPGGTSVAEVTRLASIAHVSGLVLLTAVWLLCRRRRFSLVTLERLDAVSLVGACTAWAFFIESPLIESIHGAVVSVAMTVLARDRSWSRRRPDGRCGWRCWQSCR